MSRSQFTILKRLFGALLFWLLGLESFVPGTRPPTVQRSCTWSRRSSTPAPGRSGSQPAGRTPRSPAPWRGGGGWTGPGRGGTAPRVSSSTQDRNTGDS